MQVTADDRSAFAPPPQPAMLRALALAIGAHLLLLAFLATGLQWKRDSTELSAEAELWSAVPQQAAPKAVVAPPAPPPPPPAPAPPVVRAPPQPDPQVQRDAQIALEREREKEKREEAEREEAQREAAERRRAERERKAEADRKLAAERKREEEAQKREQAAERKRAEEADKREQAKLAAEAKRKEELARKKREEQETQRVAKLREENLKRIQGMAGGTGSPSSSGTASVSSGPSASWAGRVRGRVRPNIVFSDDVAGNPTAEVEVRMAPDGTIVSRRLLKSSGNRGWDDAVLRALDKTETLPRDVDGRMPSFGTLIFRPKD